MTKRIRSELSEDEKLALLTMHGIRQHDSFSTITLDMTKLKNILQDAFKIGYNRDSMKVSYKGD